MRHRDGTKVDCVDQHLLRTGDTVGEGSCPYSLSPPSTRSYLISMQNRTIPPLEYRPDLDGLRALAVLAVVAGHAHVPMMAGGFVGVDVFFVLSGYLITAIIARDVELGRFSFSEFYERRARRILPALFFMISSVAVLGYFLFPPWQYKMFASTVLATSVFGSNIQMMISTGSYFSADASLQPLLHTWSLAVEEQFYFFFPALILIGYRWMRRAVVAAVAALCLVSFYFAVSAIPVNQSQAFYLPHLRAWELGSGALFALLCLPKIRPTWLSSLIGGTGIAMIASCILLYDETTSFPGLSALPVVLGTLLLIYAGQSREAKSTKLLSFGPCTWIGKISYSLYLWHWPPLVVVYTISDGQPGPIFTIGAVTIAFVLAWVSWRFVETPFRGKAGGLRFSRGQIFRLSGIGICSCAILAFAIFISDGIAGRVPKAAQIAFNEATPMSDLEMSCRKANPVDGKGCLLGSSNTQRSVALWGDSHAGAWIPGIDVWMRDIGVSGTAFIRSACPPLLGHERFNDPGQAGCLSWNEDVLDTLVKNDVSTVILAARWPLSYYGTRVAPERGKPLRMGLRSGNVTLEGPAAMRASLENTVRALRVAGKQVIIIGSVPEIGWSVPEKYLDKAFFGTGYGYTNPPWSKVEGRNTPVDKLLSDVSEASGAKFLPVAPYFCGKACLTEVNGHLLYRDDDHLSEMGSVIFAPKALSGIDIHSFRRGPEH